MERTELQPADVTETRRAAINVRGRRILVVRHRGELHAFDANCSHLGYDLAAGDIEEIAGQPCIRCPWHGKEFCIASGREMVGRRELSSEQKQRTHRVTVEQDGYLWVDVDEDPRREVASDRYCAADRRQPGGPLHVTAGSPRASPTDPLLRTPLAPTIASANVANVAAPATAEVVVVPPPPKAVAPAILPPLGAELKLPSPPPAPRAGGNGIMTASGFRARRQTATAAVASKPVRPPIASVEPELVGVRGSHQADIRGFMVPREQGVVRSLNFGSADTHSYGPLPMDVDF